jgi:hypothetical protein
MCATAFGVAAVAYAASAAAVTCYVVTDRNDNVIYRSTYPPVDLSDQGKPARERMRERGEYLMFADMELCPGVAFFTGGSGSRGLAFDEVVNGLPALPSNSGVSPAPSAPAAVSPATQGRAPAAPSPPAKGSASRRY